MQIGDTVEVLYGRSAANPDEAAYRHWGRIKFIEGSRIDITVRTEKGLFTIAIPRPWVAWAAGPGWKVHFLPLEDS